MSKDIRIVVMQRGWVSVAEYEQTADEITLKRSRVIQNAGAKEGFAEIAAKGPTPQTKLQHPATERTHRLMVIKTYDCNPEKWAKEFP